MAKKGTSNLCPNTFPELMGFLRNPGVAGWRTGGPISAFDPGSAIPDRKPLSDSRPEVGGYLSS